jgi:hypothetical protein
LRNFTVYILQKILPGSSNEGGRNGHAARMGDTRNIYRSLIGKQGAGGNFGRLRSI